MSVHLKRDDHRQRYIAFLRAINVGGHQVKMIELRAFFEALHYTNVETFIASGNVIFEATGSDKEGRHRERIEQHLASALGYTVPTLLRTPAEIADVISHAPLRVPVSAPAPTVHVGFLHAPLSAQSMTTLMEHETAMDTFAFRGREFYWLCLGKVTDSLVKWSKLERIVNAPMTMRNMKTVKRLADKYPV